jgi:hypothetical protein
VTTHKRKKLSDTQHRYGPKFVSLIMNSGRMLQICPLDTSEMEEATVVSTQASQVMIGSAKVRTFPTQNYNTPKEMMSTTGFSHPSEQSCSLETLASSIACPLPNEERNCLAILRSSIATGLEEIMQLNRKMDISDNPKPEETLDRLVNYLSHQENTVRF